MMVEARHKIGSQPSILEQKCFCISVVATLDWCCKWDCCGGKNVGGPQVEPTEYDMDINLLLHCSLQDELGCSQAAGFGGGRCLGDSTTVIMMYKPNIFGACIVVQQCGACQSVYLPPV